MNQVLQQSQVEASPQIRLEKLSTLEQQLAHMKSSIEQAKTKAGQELERHMSVQALPLEQNSSFVNLQHQVSNCQVLQSSQHDRLQDVIDILNNHADRLAGMEEVITVRVILESR